MDREEEIIFTEMDKLTQKLSKSFKELKLFKNILEKKKNK